MKFYGLVAVVGHNPGTNRLNFEWPWPRPSSQRSKVKLHFFANNSVQNWIYWIPNLLHYYYYYSFITSFIKPELEFLR